MTVASTLPAEMKRLASQSGRITLCGALEGFDALAAAQLARARGGVTLFVGRDLSRANSFVDALAFFDPELEVVSFPGWDCLPYDRVGPSAGVSASRMAALWSLASRGKADSSPLIVVATASGVLQRLPPAKVLREASFRAKIGDDVSIAKLERYFAVNGYGLTEQSFYRTFVLRGRTSSS